MSETRRQPARQARVRDAERSRQALLDAARVEFAEHGLAGARVDAIAARAGLNKQLISYYFGGKQGLYDAISAQVDERAAGFDAPGTTLAELVLSYFHLFQDEPDMRRIFLRDAIEQDPARVEHEPDDRDVAGLRARQQAGEIGEDLDPAFVLLFLQSMGVVSATFPRDVKRLTGLDPTSEEFREQAAEQLGRIVRRLA